MTTEAVIRGRRGGAALAAAFSLALAAPAGLTAQEKPAAPAAAGASSDPRVGLKAGFHDAGEAIRNMEKVASLPKPAGFFDPKQPKGEPTPAERPRPAASTNGSGAGAAAPDEDAPAPAGAPAAGPAAGASPAQRGGGLNFANSDLAFARGHLFVGNFHGFNTYDIEKADKLKLVASIACPGGQGDVSIHGNLLVMSVEQTRGRVDCGLEGVQDRVSKERFRGVRIFDITDLKKPKQVAAVQTCRGSHTHTLVSMPGDKENLYIYGSGTGPVRAADELTDCSGKGPEDPNTSLFSIDVIKVPLATPEKAAIVNRPRIFADPKTGALGGLWQGGNHGPNTQSSRMTNQCHDITVYPEKGLAAGACSGNGILLDISDPVHPTRLDAVTDPNFAYWHSATFNNDGSKVIYTDEWGGGTRPRCRATDLPNWGANALFEIVDKKLKFAGYYKLPAAQTEQENCVAHNGSLVPVPGRDIMVQAWYQGGISVFDFTDPAKPVEIAYFDRGPLDANQLITGGFWSAYWYNGRIYGAEIARGIDVFKLTPSEFLSKNEIEAAQAVRVDVFNAQEQPHVTWPATPVVSRAYLDQLTRANAIPAARATAVTAAIGEIEKSKKAAAADVDKLVTELEGDAASATGANATRLKLLAESLKAQSAKLR